MSSSQPKSKTQTTKEDASRIQSSQAKKGGDMFSGGFAARAQSAGDKNANANAKQSGGGGGVAKGDQGRGGGTKSGEKKGGHQKSNLSDWLG